MRWQSERRAKINYASAATAPGQHLSMELFKLMTGTNITHVPIAARSRLCGRHLGQVPISSTIWRARWVRSKAAMCVRLRSRARKRSPQLPDVPTVAEAGVPGFENYVFFRALGAEKYAAADHR